MEPDTNLDKHTTHRDHATSVHVTPSPRALNLHLWHNPYRSLAQGGLRNG